MIPTRYLKVSLGEKRDFTNADTCSRWLQTTRRTKPPNMSPKQAVVHYKTCNLMRVICRLMPISADYLQISADQCRLINEDDCKTRSTKSPNVTTRPEPKGSLRPFIKWLGMSSQPLGRASKRGTPETCPKSSDTRHRFDKGKLSNMSPKQAVKDCKTCNLMRVICRLMPISADYLPISADQCRLTKMIARQEAQSRPMSPQDLSRRGRCDPS